VIIAERTEIASGKLVIVAAPDSGYSGLRPAEGGRKASGHSRVL
jgi:hypothetical protein